LHLSAIVAFWLAANPATAAEIVFTIDPSQSASVWSGVAGAALGGGAFVEQSAGSLSAPISGHFLVSFDPSTSTPATLQFIGGHGYYQVASPHTLSPAPGGTPGTATANLGGQSSNGALSWAVRDLVWDFFSSPAHKATRRRHPSHRQPSHGVPAPIRLTIGARS
jgi:hypothetical protein